MHSPFRTKGVIVAGLLALALAAVTPTFAAAKPEPGAKKPRGFRLLAAPLGAMTINNVYCGLNSTGEVCVDSTNSSTIGGGFWPKGSADQYIFNTGLQLAGIIGSDGGSWAGDTTGAFFFDPKGTTQHGIGIEPIYNSTSASDLANWPAAANVPSIADDSGGANFNALLQGRPVASQGDVWFMSWEGDPGQNAGRKHPLGVAVETRGMGWNFPSGNQDIIYFIYTFYNITSTNPGDYVGIRPAMRDILLDAAANFHAENNAAFNVTIPSGGYTIENLYAAFATDMDVADAGVNYASVSLPFALGYTYVRDFTGTASWTFPATIFTTPTFFAGSGFAGVKYLKSPTGPGAIQLYSNTINGGAFNDPQNTIQLYRYLSGNISVPAGDAPCNTGNPTITRICYINNAAANDMRFFQSSTALTLPPGGQGSIVVAYIFAPPVAVAGCPAPGGACGGGDVKPGDPTILGFASGMGGGVNLVDSVAGYVSHADLDGNGLVEQENSNGDPEWTVVSGSLLGKSYTAQAVFDARFLLPFAPESPEFFLIPGSNQVTIIWQPSSSETSGDAYYSITSDPNNALYDPNYREFDVEGYRIYRGRVDSPDQLFLVKQFDFANTVFTDYDGTVMPFDECAPEFGIGNTVGGACPVPFQAPVPGVPRIIGYDYNVVSPFIQTKYGDRLELASGVAYLAKADTAVTGGKSGLPPMDNTGIPYIYVDNNVRNNFRYFYVVTAFDVNSVASGPSSLESSKASTIAVTPQALASNLAQTGTLTSAMVGRGGINQYDVFPKAPRINSNGTFTGPFQPATMQLGFVGFASQVVAASGALSARLDSLQVGQVDLSGCCGGGQPGVPSVYYYTVSNGVDAPFQVAVPLQQALDADVSTDIYYPGPEIDSALASMYGGDGSYGRLSALFTPTVTSGPMAGDWGLGAALAEPGFTSGDIPAGSTGMSYNGARWFDGPSPANNETMANPIGASCSTGNGSGACAANGTTAPTFNNAGALTGVTTIYQPLSYSMFNREWRNVGETQSAARRAADYNVYWGAPGVVDSVIDVTHNVVVDFDGDTLSGGWAILNTTGQGAGGFDNRPTVLTPTDWTCVAPYNTLAPGSGAGTFFPCASPTPFNLDNVATLGPIAYGSGNNQSATATKSVRNPANIQANGGFMMYIAGTITGFDMATLPTNTVWSLRDYTGVIYGGNGAGQSGNQGSYSFRAATRPFTAVHASMEVQYDVVNDFNVPASNADLAKIHTIPDPYYVTNEYESDFTAKVIKFVNLPLNATIRIYSSSGVLVRVLNYSASENGGMLDWNVRNRTNQVVASGVYFYHVESGDARFVGRMTIINFAQ